MMISPGRMREMFSNSNSWISGWLMEPTVLPALNSRNRTKEESFAFTLGTTRCSDASYRGTMSIFNPELMVLMFTDPATAPPTAATAPTPLTYGIWDPELIFTGAPLIVLINTSLFVCAFPYFDSSLTAATKENFASSNLRPTPPPDREATDPRTRSATTEATAPAASVAGAGFAPPVVGVLASMADPHFAENSLQSNPLAASRLRRTSITATCRATMEALFAIRSRYRSTSLLTPELASYDTSPESMSVFTFVAPRPPSAPGILSINSLFCGTVTMYRVR